MRGMYHPWRDARRREHLNIEFRRLPDGRRGCLRGTDVTINTADDQAQRRSTITHELVHDERQVFPRDRVLRAREERTVETIAARRLITLEALADALRWTRHEREAAAELWVDVPMLVTFIQSMTDAERDWLNAVLADD
ncbi:DNA binding protein [Gordonia phage WinkNick]|nr:DNA binding protein [Gordonia phage WinkNick]